MPIKFLSDRSQLTAKIEQVLKGPNAYAVVAYVGDGASQWLGAARPRMVVNADSNGTNPLELERLIRKLGRQRVKTLTDLHAKVYCSDQGAVVSSANLSTNGLEVLGEHIQGLVESGLYVSSSNRTLHRQISNWCSDVFRDAGDVSRELIRERKIAFAKQKHFGYRRRGKPRRPNASSSLSKRLTLAGILKNPQKFVFSFYNNQWDIRDQDRLADSKVTIEDASKQWEIYEDTGLLEVPQNRVNQVFGRWADDEVIFVTIPVFRYAGPTGDIPVTKRNATLTFSRFHSLDHILGRGQRGPSSGRQRTKKKIMTLFKEERRISISPRDENMIAKCFAHISQSQDPWWVKWSTGKQNGEPLGLANYLSGVGFKHVYNNWRRSQR
ncbi:MAG: phospholipase D family protein [Bdellovibrionales bacterium]|nr:phospholipase D family protein [Bdellovibrionales bacterium]